jgi:hypothetical protein
VRRKCRQALPSTKKENRFREVSAYSTVCPEQARGTGQRKSQSQSSSQIRIRWKIALGSMPRRFRKACCLPLSPQRSRGEPFMSPMIQLQSAAAEHRDVRRRYAASLSPFSPNRVGLVQPLCRLCVPLRCRGPVLLSVCFEARVALREI